MGELLRTTEADVQAEQLAILQELGWEFESRSDMNALRGPARMNEAIVESLLVQAIRDLNRDVDEETAHEVAARVRRIRSDRAMLSVLRDGVPYKPAPDQPTRDIFIVDARDPARNRYVVTEELALRTGGVREPRLDVVCFVNGLPLGCIENKDTSEGLATAADDWRGYWLDVPQLVAQAAVVACCNGLQMRVGPSGLDDIDGYLQWTDTWPQPNEDPDDDMRVALIGAFAPHTLVDLAVNFGVFETREGVTTKKLARAHQYRAANKLVQRVVDGKLDRGIVWHATGSGKSLTMVFAARKLMRVGLGNPTVLLVIDRTDLDEQINETLTACEFEGVNHATSGLRLAELLGSKGGGVIVTTVHKFDDSMAGLLAGERVIAFVDEAHRTQFGRFGIWMRAALPDGCLFAFTGTPIEHDARSTRAAFSPLAEDGTYESYLDRYGFDQAIADGATVKVVYEPRLAEWRLSQTDLDARFDALTVGLDEAQRDVLREQGTRESVIAKAPERVKAVAADVAEQLRDRLGPSAMGAQLVACDREACALLAEALGDHLQPDEYAVIMSRAKKDSAPRPGAVDVRDWWPSVHWERVHKRALPEAAEVEGAPEFEEDDGFVPAGDRVAITDFIARFKRENDPLRLLIVNAMLLTGFDAPIEQAMFLDRGLRGHTLMQAIARTNRRYAGKDAGLVLDYWGVFDNLKAALAEFADDDLAGLVEDTSALVARFPGLLDQALAVVAGAPSGSARRRMLWVMRLLGDNPDQAERFEELVKEAESVFETLSPDPRLAPFLPRYVGLLEVYAAWKHGTRRDGYVSQELRQKTRELVQESIGFDRLREDLPSVSIDAGFLSALAGATDLTPDEKATDIEAALVHETKVRGEDDPLGKALAERLTRLRERRAREAQMTLEGLKEWENLVSEHLSERDAAINLGLDPVGALTHAVLRAASPDRDEDQYLAVARAASEHWKTVAGFPGWSQRPDVVKGLHKALVRELIAHSDTRPLASNPQVIADLLAALATTDQPSQ